LARQNGALPDFCRTRRRARSQGQVVAICHERRHVQDDFRPVGLYIENGRELTPANTAARTGPPNQIPNFYKKPNGVFYIGDRKAGILETGRFLAFRPETNFATQSGPMLVIDGAIHPAFIVDSNDRKPRNGVGLSSPTEVHFVITKRWVNFYEFARFFRDGLGCDNALFLDGGVAPGLYAPELGRNDPPAHGGYGPIIAVVEYGAALSPLSPLNSEQSYLLR
jgi:uncharacterized protein YigE (DUF2233 family)